MGLIFPNKQGNGFAAAVLFILAICFIFALVLLSGCAGQGLPKVTEVYPGFKSPHGGDTVAVDGEVWAAGHVEWQRYMTVHDAIVAAGGRRPSGDECRVLVLRDGQPLVGPACKMWLGQETADFPLFPGDRVRVPPKWNVRIGRFFGGLLGLGTSAVSLVR